MYAYVKCIMRTRVLNKILTETVFPLEVLYNKEIENDNRQKCIKKEICS